MFLATRERDSVTIPRGDPLTTERRILVAGGGTGGHIYPALSIAREFMRRHDGAKVLYVGTRDGLEASLVPGEGLPFASIRVKGLVRKSPADFVRGLFLLGWGLWGAARIVARFAPHVVVGTGGYVSGPVVAAAWLQRIPTLIQEQDVLPGVANRWLSRIATTVVVPSESSEAGFPRGVRHKLVVTGNAVRTEVLAARRDEARGGLGLAQGDRLLLVLGGSRGAASINRAMVDFLVSGGHTLPGLSVVYVTGHIYYQEVERELEAAGLGTKRSGLMVVPYLHDMPKVLAAADLCLCRAGALTLAEATARGLPLVLVPSPNVTHNHQEHNARALERAGAAEVILDRDLSGETIQSTLVRLLADPHRLRRMADNSRAQSHPEALRHIVDLVDELVRSGRGGKR